MNSAFDPASPFLGNFAKIMKKLMKLIFFIVVQFVIIPK